MKRYISNAFSLQMVAPGATIFTKRLDLETVKVLLNPTRSNTKSIIGHADTAAVLSEIVGRKITHNRESITLAPGDILIVAQIVGGRLPEGATTLPDNFEIEFLMVSVSAPLSETAAPLENSVNGAVMRRATELADEFGGEAKPCLDPHGNFVVEVGGGTIIATLFVN